MTIAAQMLMGKIPAHPSSESRTNKTSSREEKFPNLLTDLQRKEANHTNRGIQTRSTGIREEHIHKLSKTDKQSEDTGSMSPALLKQIQEQLEELNRWQDLPESDLAAVDPLLEELQDSANKILDVSPEENELENILALLIEKAGSLRDQDIKQIMPISLFPLNVNYLEDGIDWDQSDVSMLVKHTGLFLNKWNSQPLHQSDAKQLLQLLAQWSKLTDNQPSIMQYLQSEIGTDKKAHIFFTLLTNFKNREDMQQKYGYANKVTQKDIQNWLSRAMENNEATVRADSTSSNNSFYSQAGQPIDSKVQQFVIHLQQTNNDQAQIQKQLMDQFQHVLSKSSFMKLANGTNQLTLRLQPEYLGDIHVKLNQVNGEMIVKMIVQSQGAKELLEGNMTQLRHLFSPHQVTIEKMDNLYLSPLETLAEGKQEEKGEGNQQAQDNQEEDTENENINFHDLLMDAKV